MTKQAARDYGYALAIMDHDTPTTAEERERYYECPAGAIEQLAREHLRTLDGYKEFGAALAMIESDGGYIYRPTDIERAEVDRAYRAWRPHTERVDVSRVMDDTGMTRQAVHKALASSRLDGVRIDGRWQIVRR